MPIEKKDPTFIERFILPLFGLIAGSAFIGIIIMGALFNTHERLAVTLVCSLIALMLIAIVVLHRIVLGHYKCPQCQAEIPRHSDPTRPDKTLFYCRKCDILWDTGLEGRE